MIQQVLCLIEMICEIFNEGQGDQAVRNMIVIWSKHFFTNVHGLQNQLLRVFKAFHFIVSVYLCKEGRETHL